MKLNHNLKSYTHSKKDHKKRRQITGSIKKKKICVTFTFYMLLTGNLLL